MDRDGCLAAVVALVIIVFVVLAGGFSCWNKHIHGNKQFIDMKQEFNTAYVKIGDKTEKIKISQWNDYNRSDTIQVVCTDGRVLYTHSSNVVLTNEK